MELTANRPVADLPALPPSARQALALVELAPHAVLVVDAHGRIAYLSARAHRLLALPPAAPGLGRSLLEWVAPKDRARAAEHLAVLACSPREKPAGPAPAVELCLVTERGRMFEAEMHLAVLPPDPAEWVAGDGPAGAIPAPAIACYVRSLGHRAAKEVQRRRRLEEQRFAARLAALHEVSLDLALTPTLDALCRRTIELAVSRLGFERIGLFLVDATASTPTVHTTYGVDTQGQVADERGRTIDLTEPKHRPWLPLFTGQTPFVYFEDDQLLDDAMQPIARGEHAAAGLWDGNQVIGMLVIDNLVTHAPIDDRQRHVLVLFAHMVGHLCSLKQAQAQVEAERAAAEEANRAKSLFLASMSHEIRTPMNAVMGMTSLLLDTELAAEQREFVETIRNSSDALLTIINDILDFSKIESGRMDLEVQDFAPAACIEEALDLFAAKAADKQLELACRIAPDTPDFIKGDVTRVRQILVNLIGNAIKFTEHGEIVVEVHRELCADCPDYANENSTPGGDEACLLLHFSVRDTGIGIPPDRIDALFQSFTQVDASTTRKYGGTGLGLAISRRLAQLMGGTMWVDSRPGHGSNFHFTIRTRAAAAAPAPISAADLVSQRVLIVDDNHTNCFILTEQTRRWGMEPMAVQSAAAALALLDGGARFDLAVLDLHMPEMDGLQLAGLLRQRPEEQQFPLVMLTSLGDSFLREQAIKLGFAAFVTKPIKQAHLHDLLARSIQHAEAPLVRPAAPPVFDRTFAERHPLHILLAEDNVVNQKVARQILGKLGYNADIAANGQEAVEAIDRQHYDLVLMDIIMPELDGLQATRQIRGIFPPECQPVILAMTAAATNEDRQACLDAGMNGYISKPIRLDQLMAELEQVIRT